MRLAAVKCWMVLLVSITVTSCRQENVLGSKSVARKPAAIDPLSLALAPHAGTNRVDQQISRLQQEVRSNQNVEPSLECLGWAFVAKARESFDAGYYKLAEQCALVLEARHPNCAEGLLLRGHALVNLHQFKEAERLAR